MSEFKKKTFLPGSSHQIERIEAEQLSNVFVVKFEFVTQKFGVEAPTLSESPESGSPNEQGQVAVLLVGQLEMMAYFFNCR